MCKIYFFLFYSFLYLPKVALLIFPLNPYYMKQIFTILLIILTICFFKPNSANAQINVNDSLALVDLYNSTNGPNWNDHTNWLTSAPVSTWYGILSVQITALNK